ncbi:MAG TPA: TIGR02757 family protein [Dissulfurispiraceae bacterium]|nr:TIGR02757 family protein [Dissulfurispiraceae bacterium]
MRRDLKSILDNFYLTFDFEGTRARDPIEFPHSYTNKADQEISGFIASAFAYGNVNLFKPVVGKLLSKMGAKPYEFILGFNVKRQRRLFDGIKYRFNENDDIVAFFHMLHELLKKYASIEAAFKAHFRQKDPDIGKGLAGLIDDLISVDTTPVYGDNLKPAGLLQFIPSPRKGSACKRMNLYLRWMIRDTDIDFGLWKGIHKNKLVIPLDTHISRISKCLGFTARKSQDWKMAVEITESLKKLDPEDPLKYDFALCHQGISKVCSSKNCEGCELFR